MVLCVIPGCGSRTGRDKGVGFYRIPTVVTNKGEFAFESLPLSRCLQTLKYFFDQRPIKKPSSETIPSS